MKNKYIALIVAMLTMITAYAGDTKNVVLASTNEPIEFSIEPHWTGMYQRSKSESQWGTYQWNNTEALSLGADFKNGWDLEAEQGVSRSTGPDQQTGGYTELKLRYTWELSKKWDFSLRGGIGDGYSYTDPTVPNVPYWLAQARLKYKINDKWTTWVRYEPGSALNTRYGNTFVNTIKLAVNYEVVKGIELGARYITAFGENYQGNGVELVLEKSF
jgi:hypothetical protein